jgi:diphosphomevalonate decarboxylase
MGRPRFGADAKPNAAATERRLASARGAALYAAGVAVASARANIALVKYWGKRDARLNLPAAGSLSLTLEALETRTRVTLGDGAADALVLDGAPAGEKATARVSRFLELVRRRAGRTERARVESANTFPTAAGLASSASAFAALARAAADAYGLDIDDRALSVLARRGSGSAARSVFGGFARMHAGTRDDGADAFAEPVVDARVELAAVVCAARADAKTVGSTEGMERTRRTSPYHAAWIAQVEADLGAAEAALASGDFARLADVVEGSCLAMHANAMAARPGIIYFRAPTLWAMERVRALRAGGTPVCFTVDAGPHVVAFTPPDHADSVAEALRGHPEMARIFTSSAGAGARAEERFSR